MAEQHSDQDPTNQREWKHCLEVSEGPVVRLRPPGSVEEQDVLSDVLSTVLSLQHPLTVHVDGDEARGLTGRDAGAVPDSRPPDWVD